MIDKNSIQNGWFSSHFMLVFHHCFTICECIWAFILMIIECNIFTFLSLTFFFSLLIFSVFISFFLSFFIVSIAINFFFFFSQTHQKPKQWKKLFLIASPMRMKLATVIQNTQANESVSETKEINHEFDEEYNTSNNSSNNSTFGTSTSILVSQIENKIYEFGNTFIFCIGWNNYSIRSVCFPFS